MNSENNNNEQLKGDENTTSATTNTTNNNTTDNNTTNDIKVVEEKKTEVLVEDNKNESNTNEVVEKSDSEKQNNNQKVKMFGKKLQIFTNELSFGSNVKMVNAFGLFKYNKNNTHYVVFADEKNEYNIVSFATAHIKETSILTLDAKKQEDFDAAKEYVFKVTNNEDLSDFEMISMDGINTIEIIGSSKLEVKPEVISKLIELTIPKPEVEVKVVDTKTKKKSPIKIILILLVLASLGVGGYLYLENSNKEPEVSKSILCTKNYPHEELEADVIEEKTFNFGPNDELQNVETSETYQFRTNDDYLEFINQAEYYKYMPEETAANGGFKLDDENSRYIVNMKDEVTDTYSLPTAYEDVLSYYKGADYTCEESIAE